MVSRITVEDSTTFYRPILELYKDGEIHKSEEIKRQIRESLPDDEKEDERVENCMTWPIQHFFYAKCLSRERPGGYYRITDRGIDLLNMDMDRISESTLMELYPDYERRNPSQEHEDDIEDLENETMDKNTSFDDALRIVKSLLKNAGTDFEGTYDMLLVKELSPSDLINDNKPSSNRANTTQIALTSEKMDIFPFLESFSYFYDEGGDYNTDLKTNFLLEVPVRLYSSNFKYLNIYDKDFDFEQFNNEIIETTTTVLRRRTNKEWNLDNFKRIIDTLESNDYKFRMKLLGYEVQAELSSGRSGLEFKEFRKLLYKDFYLIILKHKEEFKYDVFAVLPDDGKDILPKFELYMSSEKTITKLSPGFWTNVSSNEIDEDNLSKLWTTDNIPNKIESNGENILIYGVPGSGKSYTIREDYCDDESRMERVVFHPDYTYSDFIGQILPKEYDDGKIKYEFTEGPFTSILKKACSHPSKRYYLIIEEINRGNAPAIFGDVFQLLDRKTKCKENNDDGFPLGTSEYAISNSEIAFEIYKNKDNKVRIPPNLSIIATMNTADQNVFTLDTAFQRRWKMRLIPNKFKEDHKFAEDKILDTTVSWKQFVMYINDLILQKNTLMTSSEDKRLGVYFVQKEDLQQSDEDDEKNENFAEKVLKYLWDDAFKFSRKDLFSEKYRSLEDVIDKFNSSNGNDRLDVFKDKQDLIDFKVSEDTNG